ncbi:hypothetical protein HFP05_00620 [Rhodanobacter denitrificans]|nr:hypothetical protein [Rhodanobacter denitrificans]
MSGENLIDSDGPTPPFTGISVSLSGVAKARHSVHHELVTDGDMIRGSHVNQHRVIRLLKNMPLNNELTLLHSGASAAPERRHDDAKHDKSVDSAPHSESLYAVLNVA